MAQKIFKQFFAKNFVGIDGETSALDETEQGVARAVNYEMAVSNSLRGRVGCQTSGNQLRPWGVFPYTYTRTKDEYAITYASTSIGTTRTAADGATINKLMAINRQLWVLDTMTIPVTRVSGSYPFTWYTTVSGSNINFVIKDSTTTILNTSLGSASTVTIYDLLATIDAIPELSINRDARGTCPPVALIAGAVTTTVGASATYGTRYVATVTAHNFLPGDIITFKTSDSTIGLAAGIVIAVTATTITYVGPSVTIGAAQTLGYMGQPADAFPITIAASAASGTLNLVFPYWRYIPEGDSKSGGEYGLCFESAWAEWTNKFGNSRFFAPPVSTNDSGCLYIATSGKVSDNTTNYSNNLVKTDGLTLVRAGLPEITMTATPAAGGALAGAFKYKAFLKRTDAQGNIVEGVPSEVVTATYGGGNDQGTIVLTPPTYVGATGFQGRSCYKYLNEAPADPTVSFTVDDNSAAPGLNAFIQPGDPIILMDNTAPLTGLTGTEVGTLHRTFCTYYEGAATPATGPASIKVADSSGYTIVNNSPISTGLTVVVVRSTAGGNLFYKLCEVPITGYGTFTFTDNVADAVLTAQEQFIDAPIGKEHNPPPPCSLVCQHQGGLVVARGTLIPNTVAFSSADGSEYFPTASNSFVVPSTQSGAITAIASDTNDRLAVFKERAYYDVVGDLDGGVFSINVKNEGDYGITSQAGLVRIQEVLIGPSRNGLVLINDGSLAWLPYKKLNARLINQDYYFQYATGVNDSFNRHYICSIPITSSTIASFVIDYSREFPRFYERSYPLGIDQGSGMAVVGESFYHLSYNGTVFRRLERFNGNSPTGNNGDSFIDNTSAISYILETKVINNGEPDVLNTPIRARVWSIPNDYVIDGWVEFAALLEGGCTALATYVGSANTNGTSSTITFTANTNLFKDVKLVSTKTHFYILRLTTNAIRTAPFITGYEILYAESYRPEDLIK